MNDENKVRAAGVGALEAVISAMRIHLQHPGVQEQAGRPCLPLRDCIRFAGGGGGGGAKPPGAASDLGCWQGAAWAWAPCERA